MSFPLLFFFFFLPLSALLPLLIYSRSGYKAINADFKESPFWGLDHSLKRPNCEWFCSLEASHSTFMHNTQSPTEEHLDCNDPNSFFFFALHCHLGLRNPTFRTVSGYLKTRLSAHCHGKGAESFPEMEQKREERTDTSTGPSLVCMEVRSLGGRAGWWAARTPKVTGMRTRAHTCSSWSPSCCLVLLVRGAYSGVGKSQQGGARVVLLWSEACGWLLIPVNQRHYGDLKIFLVSLQIMVIMAALF